MRNKIAGQPSLSGLVYGVSRSFEKIVSWVRFSLNSPSQHLKYGDTKLHVYKMADAVHQKRTW